MTPPFQRTVCGCKADRENCHQQPGYLVPGDLERIAAYLGNEPKDVHELFWASPGAVVARDGQLYRIGTITPRREEVNGKARCVFLNDDGQCVVHPVAPFGCAYFDVHLPLEEGQARSMWGLRTIIEDGAYTALRNLLTAATSWNPKPY